MKRVTASEARRRWFSILDEVVKGEVITIIRRGTRVVLRRETSKSEKQGRSDYASILKVKQADRADAWHWEWSDKGISLRSSRKK